MKPKALPSFNAKSAWKIFKALQLQSIFMRPKFISPTKMKV